MEMWDVRDRCGNTVGRTVERGKPLPDGDYHLVVDVWIKNNSGDYLITRRAKDKYPDPGLWEPTCGSVMAGEDSFDGALREVREELGLELDPAAGVRIRRSVIPNDTLVDVWLFTQAFDLHAVTLQQEEVDDACWASVDEINRLMAEGQFIPARRVPYLNELLHHGIKPLSLRAACLMTHNIEKMAAFYTQLFAHPPEVDAGVDYRFIDVQLTVFKLTDADAPPTRNAALIYQTDDADAVYERLNRLGLAQTPPTDKPWGVRSFFVTDPDGNTVSFAAPLKTREA